MDKRTDFAGSLLSELRSRGNEKKARILSGFFKTGKGEYGEGDKFLGIAVPIQREIASRNWEKPSLREIRLLLQSEFHEARLTALLILLKKFQNAGTDSERREIFDFYLLNAERINNWDLVDVTCPGIVGEFLAGKDWKILRKMASSSSLWERRIAIVSTFAFTRRGEFFPTLEIAKALLSDKEDLLHKACGWMLREVGKRDEALLKRFLSKHAARMPRTMLRYSIEKFPKGVRTKFLRIPVCR